MNNVRVRFAPSPTGPLHMGGVRTALFNYLFAKKNKGTFILRIEDTDQKRLVPQALEYIKESLEWSGLVPDEGAGYGGEYGPYIQSERSEIYKKYIAQLIESGHAYYAFDTTEELDEVREKAVQAGFVGWQYNYITRQNMKNSLTLAKDIVDENLKNGVPYVVRIKLPVQKEIKFTDIIRGVVSTQTNNLDDKVLWKSEGLPTYHLANIVDDYLMKITHVIRGEEWLPSAPLHNYLYDCFGWKRPEFAHLPLILKPDGKGKLSKRDGDRLGFPVFPLNWHNQEENTTSVGYKEQGYLPEGFINMLAMLGWNPGTQDEFFSMEKLIEIFSLEKVNKSGSKFDPKKALWYNQKHLQNQSDDKILEWTKTLLTENNIKFDEGFDWKSLVPLIKERATLKGDLLENSLFFFKEVPYDREKIASKLLPETKEILLYFKDLLNSKKPKESLDFKTCFENTLEKFSLSFGKIGPFIRYALTYQLHGAQLFDIMKLLGVDNCKKRIDNFIKEI